MIWHISAWKTDVIRSIVLFVVAITILKSNTMIRYIAMCKHCNYENMAECEVTMHQVYGMQIKVLECPCGYKCRARKSYQQELLTSR